MQVYGLNRLQRVGAQPNYLGSAKMMRCGTLDVYGGSAPDQHAIRLFYAEVSNPSSTSTDASFHAGDVTEGSCTA